MSDNGCGQASAHDGGMANDDAGVAASGPIPWLDRPVPWPPPDWRCLRWRGI